MPREMFPVASAMLVSAINSFPQLLILLGRCAGRRLEPRPVGLLAGFLGFAIITVLGTALALLFSPMNVFFRDFQNIVATFPLFIHWIVPMIYPFSKLATSSLAGTWLYKLYLSNPLTIAVLLLQRCVLGRRRCRPDRRRTPPDAVRGELPDSRHLIAARHLDAGRRAGLPGALPAGLQPARGQVRGAPLMTESIVVDHANKQLHDALPPHDQADHDRGHAAPDDQRHLPAPSTTSRFTIEQGESVGLMGLNGSGQEHPAQADQRRDAARTPARCCTRGRIAGLIATGAGFHPQLTGRDNVYLNAAILGMSEAETKRKFDQIVDFADIGRFLDTPVGHYSSGMFSRLGFAVAVHTDSDIFLDRRGARGGGPAVQEEVPGPDAGDPRRGPHDGLRQPRRRPRCARCATGCWSSRRACSASTGDVDEGIQYLQYDDDDEDEVGSEEMDDGRTSTRSSARTSDRRRQRTRPAPPGGANYTHVVRWLSLASLCDRCDIWGSCGLP